jgi:hypothetical protein
MIDKDKEAAIFIVTPFIVRKTIEGESILER